MNEEKTQTDQTKKKPVNEKEMPFLDHLEELRWRLIKSIAAIFVGAIIVYFFGEYVLHLLVRPYKNVAESTTLIFLQPTGGFMIYLEIGLFGGIVLALPIIFYQLWLFIAPGLYERERSWVLAIIFVSTLSFMIGALFAYFVMIPIALKFLLTFESELLSASLTIQEYLSFVLTLLFVAGMIFEMPLVAFFLTKIGLLTPKFMREKRRYGIVIILILAAILTPPDLMTQLLLAVPLILLYEISIFVSYFAGKPKKEKKQETPDEPEEPPKLEPEPTPPAPSTDSAAAEPASSEDQTPSEEPLANKTESEMTPSDETSALTTAGPVETPGTTEIGDMPAAYLGFSDSELESRILKIKKEYGKRLVILGHHYQNDKVINLTDFQGDSFGLAKLAAENHEAEFIVFCGVNFMAESARILARPEQTVLHPDFKAGCPLADYAEIAQVEAAWEAIGKVIDLGEVIPLTYINSTSEIKAFCGAHQGATCTSSNAHIAFHWAFNQHKRILFVPDEHLGHNTAAKLSIPPDQIAVWDPQQENGGLSAEHIQQAQVILWKGHCHVHTFFTVEHVKDMRGQYPEAKIIAHPECKKEVVDLCDADGSTEMIRRYVEKAQIGETIIVGTEINLVQRLDRENPYKTILPLAHSDCPDMARINLPALCWTLENLGKVNVVHVEKPIAEAATLALNQMLAFSGNE